VPVQYLGFVPYLGRTWATPALRLDRIRFAIISHLSQTTPVYISLISRSFIGTGHLRDMYGLSPGYLQDMGEADTTQTRPWGRAGSKE